MNPLLPYLEPLPLIAVLRGITPEEIPAISAALVAAGFRVLEVPLNSPRPFESIRLLANACGERCLVGAGTVVDVADVARVREAGGKVVVMPHADTAVIRAAKGQGLVCVPGVATPTEGSRRSRRVRTGSRCFRRGSATRSAQSMARGPASRCSGIRRRWHPPRQHGRLLERRRVRLWHGVESLRSGRAGGRCPRRGGCLRRRFPSVAGKIAAS
jgi:hypothetical protein